MRIIKLLNYMIGYVIRTTSHQNQAKTCWGIFISPPGLKGLKYIYFHVRDTRVFGLIRIFLINFMVDNWHLITARIANRSLENGIFLGLLSDCSVLCLSVCLSSITLWHRLSYRAENLNIASLLGYLGRFLSVFRNFAFFGL